MTTEIAIIVEGYSEYDGFPSIISKIIGQIYCPLSNAKGIGNIVANTGEELLKVIKLLAPKKIIITLDYREAQRQGIVNSCVELKELVQKNCNEFLESQQNGSLVLPEEIVVVIVDKTFETWICADLDALKESPLIDGEKIHETFQDIDAELLNPSDWLSSKLKSHVDLKSKAHRKNLVKNIRPEVAKTVSRSFRKFHDEIQKIIGGPF